MSTGVPSVPAVIKALKAKFSTGPKKHYLVVAYTGFKNASAQIDLNKKKRSCLGFDVIGPLEKDMSLEATRILEEQLIKKIYSIHDMVGHFDEDCGLMINPTMEHWKRDFKARITE